ncbi:MAG: hypothetical protein JXD23_01450 [Spirochaetales bacterium]|nr:hypothetical protein [Spirochaetales bacterium]
MESYDGREIRCRRLGHDLTFAYCRAEREGRPCPRIMECWRAVLPVEDWLAACFAPDEISYLGEAPPSKISSLIELIEKARAAGMDGEKPGRQ